MSTYRQLIYMALDEVKGSSDDLYFTEEHVAFLLDKYRTTLLKQRYSDVRRNIPESNYQTLCLDLEEVPSIPGLQCGAGSYLRSIEKIPVTLKIGQPWVYPVDYFQGHNIAFISRDRMKFVGYNKYLQNIIYCTIGPDNYLYLKSANPQFLYLGHVRMTAIFEDSRKAAELMCDGNTNEEPCNPLDREFPLEEPLVSFLLDMVVNELRKVVYGSADVVNNAHDDYDKVVSVTKARNNTNDGNK